MPFKFFTVHHKKGKKDKSNSISATDVSERKTEETIDNDAKSENHKSNDKLKHHFFSINKPSNHVHVKNRETDRKEKIGGGLFQYMRTKSLSHIPTSDGSAGPADSCSADHRSHNDLRLAGTKKLPRGSASYGAHMDTLGRERRLMEIAQLDNYMKYLRNTEDEGNMTNRLCCAQVLRMSLIRLEQMHRNSQERIDHCHRQSPTAGHRQSHKNNILKSQVGTEDKQCTSHSDKKSVNEHLHVKFTSDQDSDGRDSERDSGSEPDSEENYSASNNYKKPVINKISAVWPSDIEIF